ncbi:MAG: polysaccharide deacetylase family protein [Oscillospiraceae bacterium]
MVRRSRTLLRKFILIAVLVYVVCITGLLLQRKEPPKLQGINTTQKTMVAKVPKVQKIPKPGIDIEAVGALPDSAKKNGYDAIEIWERLRSENISPLGKDEVRNIPGTKTVFLTFDDGPSTTNTPQILGILKEYDVKATFCILGSRVNSDRTKELLKREFAEGHAIANHTYSHNYDYLYPKPERNVNLENFKADLKKTDDVFKDVIGHKFSTRVVRCPGGMMTWKNMEPLKEYLKANNMASIDWNALTGDAEGKKKNAQELFEYMKKDIVLAKSVDENGNKVEELSGLVVLLMHDTDGKEETVKALPSVIEYFKNHGFEFKILV